MEGKEKMDDNSSCRSGYDAERDNAPRSTRKVEPLADPEIAAGNDPNAGRYLSYRSWQTCINDGDESWKAVIDDWDVDMDGDNEEDFF